MSNIAPSAVQDIRPGWLGDARRSATADCVLLLLVALAATASLVDGSGVARALLVGMAACLVPGAGLLTGLPSQEPLEALALAVTASLCIEAACALVMIWTGWWHPVGLALALTGVAAVMFALDLRRTLMAGGAR